MLFEALRSTPGRKNAPHLALDGLLEYGRRERANEADFAVTINDHVVVIVVFALYGLLARSATGKRVARACGIVSWHGMVSGMAYRYIGVANSSSEKRGKRHEKQTPEAVQATEEEPRHHHVGVITWLVGIAHCQSSRRCCWCSCLDEHDPPLYS